MLPKTKSKPKHTLSDLTALVYGPSKIGKAVYSGLRAARSLANWLDLKAQDRLDAYDYNDLVTNEAGFRS